MPLGPAPEASVAFSNAFHRTPVHSLLMERNMFDSSTDEKMLWNVFWCKTLDCWQQLECWDLKANDVKLKFLDQLAYVFHSTPTK